MAGFWSGFKESREAALNSRAVAKDRPPFEPLPSWRDEEPFAEPSAAPPGQAVGLAAYVAELEARNAGLQAESDRKQWALDERTRVVERLQARCAGLQAESDERKQALDGLAPVVDALQAHSAGLEAELREREAECDEMKQALDGLVAFAERKTQALDELVPVVEQLQARVAELEAMPDGGEIFAEVLRLPAISMKTVKVPSVKNLLLDRFHPEKHPKADDEARQALKERTQKINAAYDVIKRDRRPPGE